METCKSCRRFNEKTLDHGQCRDAPPTGNLVPVQGIGGQSLSVVSFWPEVKADDWCGKHVPAYPDTQAPLKLI